MAYMSIKRGNFHNSGSSLSVSPLHINTGLT